MIITEIFYAYLTGVGVSAALDLFHYLIGTNAV